MNTTEIMQNVTRQFHKVGFEIKKHSPEILLVAGVVGTVTSAVMACKATMKLQPIINEAKEEIDDIHSVIENPELLPAEITEEDTKKALVGAYVKTGVKIARLYAPSVALGAASITTIFTSNGILRKRNIALAAAYTTIDRSFKGYRSRVVERFGEELDRELKYNIKTKEIKVKEVDENGKEKTVKKKVQTIDPSTAFGEYTRVWEDGNPGYTKDPDLNMMYLKRQQDYANDLLKSRGYLFFNDVLEMLGYRRCKIGQVVGWIYNENNPIGDNYVDFGIFNFDTGINNDFINGVERAAILDFNVDGPILDYIDDIR